MFPALSIVDRNSPTVTHQLLPPPITPNPTAVSNASRFKSQPDFLYLKFSGTVWIHWVGGLLLLPSVWNGKRVRFLFFCLIYYK